MYKQLQSVLNLILSLSLMSSHAVYKYTHG